MRQKFLRMMVILFGFALGWGSAQEKVPDAVPEPEMRGELEAVFKSWRTAMIEGSFEDWKKVTAPTRQIEVENEIVSQRAEFPDALFAAPLSPPSLEGLQFLNVFTRRVTATVIYFGKADFQVGNPNEVKDTLIVLSFFKETDKWQFDRLRVVKIPDNSQILGQIRVSDFSFLEGDEFQPAKALPDMPRKVSKPDYIAQINVNSVGYASTIEVNGHEVGTITNTSAEALIIGGLRKGLNTVEFKARKLDEADFGVPDRLEIAIYAVKSVRDKPNRVFHFIANENEIPEKKRVNFGMDD